jgi:CDGSH-type Zn-finger protein
MQDKTNFTGGRRKGLTEIHAKEIDRRALSEDKPILTEPDIRKVVEEVMNIPLDGASRVSILNWNGTHAELLDKLLKEEFIKVPNKEPTQCRNARNGNLCFCDGSCKDVPFNTHKDETNKTP